MNFYGYEPINDKGQTVEGGHTFVLDDAGETDDLIVDQGYHNGPFCTSCGEGFCHHCHAVYEAKCPSLGSHN